MTPAPCGETKIESEGAGTRQTNSREAAPPPGLAASLGEKYVCSWPGGGGEMLLCFFCGMIESEFMASLTTADIFQAPTRRADVK